MSDDLPNFDDAMPPPHLRPVERRTMLDSAKPWLEAGRSWTAAADRIEAYDAHKRGHPRRPWNSVSTEERQLRARAEAARWHARRLDRFTARGWFVWHDRFATATRNVVDHIMVGPGGVVVLQSIPSFDHAIENGVRRTGPDTVRTLDTSMELLRKQIVPAIHAAASQLLPEDWNLLVRGHNVLIDKTLPGTYTDVERPETVADYVAKAGAWLAPVDVQLLASILDDLVPPAPLAG